MEIKSKVFGSCVEGINVFVSKKPDSIETELPKQKGKYLRQCNNYKGTVYFYELPGK